MLESMGGGERQREIKTAESFCGNVEMFFDFRILEASSADRAGRIDFPD